MDSNQLHIRGIHESGRKSKFTQLAVLTMRIVVLSCGLAVAAWLVPLFAEAASRVNRDLASLAEVGLTCEAVAHQPRVGD
ncbi:hypothetical protein ACH4T9_26505 [Micromonospora sp. NPDC020750]|uniref:hypothetical protein n=1 Tax=unclassified Micromonospora TaxID=2617518 RepID=UPI00378F1E84